jgi:carbon storage regulator
VGIEPRRTVVAGPTQAGLPSPDSNAVSRPGFWVYSSRGAKAGCGELAVLVLSRGAGQSIMIGHDIRVTVLAVSPDGARLGVEAPSETGVHREEVYIEIQHTNERAATSAAELDGR